MKRSIKKVAAWIALWAISVLSFAPAISHALAISTQSSDPWQQLCSVHGIKNLAAGGSDQNIPSRTGEGINADHCPLCSANAHHALPGSPSMWVFKTATSHTPAFFCAPSYGSAYELFAEPRGPPAFL